MWFRFGILSFISLSLIIFLSISISLISILTTSLLEILDLSGSYAIFVLSVSLIIAFFSALSLNIFQFYHHISTKNRWQRKQERVAYWTTNFTDALLFNDPLPEKITETAAAQALLDLCEGFDEETTDRISELYANYGFLEKDLADLRKRNHAETRSKIIERLSLIHHPQIINALKRELNRKESDLQILAFQALARSFSHSSIRPDEVKRTILPLIHSKFFGFGLIEEALVVLGDNASSTLHSILHESDSIVLKKISMNVVARSQNYHWAHWCAVYLTDRKPELRAAALRSMSRLQFVPLYAYDTVTEALSDDIWFVRVQAAHASLFVLSDIEPALVNALSDQNWWVRYNSAKTLKRRGQHGEDHLLWASEHHGDRYARDMAAQILAMPSDSLSFL